MEPNLPVNLKTSWTYQGMELGPFVLVAGKLEFPSKPPPASSKKNSAQKAKGHTF